MDNSRSSANDSGNNTDNNKYNNFGTIYQKKERKTGNYGKRKNIKSGQIIDNNYSNNNKYNDNKRNL